jgi:L-alanine-DL-glutamate epimerase-like enolase superfamily enzyme
MHDPKVTRRTFLRSAAGAALLGVVPPVPAFVRRLGAAPVIERITVLRVPGEFNRFVAMNAYDAAPKGKTGTIRVARVDLSDGTSGVGVVGYRFGDATAADLRRLIGQDPLAIHQWDNQRIRGFAPAFDELLRELHVAWIETPLLDAIGKLQGKPVWRLFGPSVREAADCYDGTLYFADVVQQRDARAIGEIAARIQGDGYRAIKLKLGRPFKWIPGEAGVERDIEAFLAAREAVGANFNLMADANNGYEGHPDWALRLLRACAPHDMYWIEEIFGESVDGYRSLRRAMFDAGCSVRIADGENLNRVDDLTPYLQAGVLDVAQPDMRTAGFSNILRAADTAAKNGAMLVPHNWQSEMGKIMSIHAARLRLNIPFVEDDRYHTHAFDASDYLFRDGRWHAPETPGWGVRLVDWERFAGEDRELEIA